jgi:hypothetical protein
MGERLVAASGLDEVVSSLTPERRASRNATRRAWLARNRERINAQRRAYFVRNREHVLAQQRARHEEQADLINDWRRFKNYFDPEGRAERNAARRLQHALHREEDNAKRRTPYAANLERERAKKRAYYWANREQILVSQFERRFARRFGLA